MAPQLSRLMIIFGIIAAMFLVVRFVARPDSFSWYGHYRGAALSEVSSYPVKYVDRSSCAECHDDEAALNAAGPHEKISCQACHGPGQAHLEDPTAENIKRPEVMAMCLRCHDRISSRPKSFPQIDRAEHTEGQPCGACHNIHDPSEIE
jgi:hypothetical protein